MWRQCLKMLISLEGAHASNVSTFCRVERLRTGEAVHRERSGTRRQRQNLAHRSAA
jgi:hypothetical protein